MAFASFQPSWREPSASKSSTLLTELSNPIIKRLSTGIFELEFKEIRIWVCLEINSFTSFHASNFRKQHPRGFKKQLTFERKHTAADDRTHSSPHMLKAHPANRIFSDLSLSYSAQHYPLWPAGALPYSTFSLSKLQGKKIKDEER